MPELENSCSPPYLWTFYLQVRYFILKFTSYQKMDSLNANSIFAVQNDGTYPPWITKEICNLGFDPRAWRHLSATSSKIFSVVRKYHGFWSLIVTSFKCDPLISNVNKFNKYQKRSETYTLIPTYLVHAKLKEFLIKILYLY